MIKRYVPILGVALIGMLITPMLATTAPATSYGFEECAEGWTVTESSNDPAYDVPPTAQWQPAPPGNPDGTPVQSFRTQPYPQAAQNGNPEEESYQAWLTSPEHSFGAASKISYYVKHNLETVPENPLVTGGDYVEVLLLVNGQAPKKVGILRGLSTGWVKKEVAVPSAGQVKLQFHLYSDNNTSGEGNSGGEVSIDDVVFPAPRPAGATCGGGGGEPKCTKSGTGKADTLRGTSGADRLCGKGGNDKLYGKGGNDVLLGGKGRRDVCIGGPGKDTFKGCEKKEQ